MNNVTTFLVQRIYLLAGSKSSKAVIIDVKAKRVEARDVNIESEVELVAVDEQWSRDVLLDDDWPLLRHVLPLVDDTDADTSCRRRLNHRHTDIV